MNTLQRIISWIGGERYNLKYIGKLPILVTLNDEENKKTLPQKISMSILFFMSDSGKRKVEYPTVSGYNFERGLQTYKWGLQTSAWLKGGEFPEDFVPQVDTLGPMLMKIVDIQMGLGKEDE